MTDFDQMALIERLYPLHRTLVSDDIDKTLEIIREVLPQGFQSNFRVVGIPSGSPCWTWSAPQKYTVKDAYIETLDGERIVDFHDNALHLVSYSRPIDQVMPFAELAPHLHYSDKRPGAIPWRFAYYQKTWGFCLPFNLYKQLDRQADYRVVIDAEFSDDALKIGELCISGRSERELLVVTNICHPYQVNDSISGVSAVIDALHRLQGQDFDKSLRLLFLPETIGSICYFAHHPSLRENIDFGLFTEMLGNNDSLALQYSYQGDSGIDRLAEAVLRDLEGDYRSGPFRSIVGNDELVTNGPGLNIPTISLSRSKRTLDSFPEYHSSDDCPSLLIEEHLQQAAGVLTELFKRYDGDYRPRRRFMGPVFLSGHDLWGVWGDIPLGKEIVDQIMFRLEGDQSVSEIAEAVGLSFAETKRIVDAFAEKGLVEKL